MTTKRLTEVLKTMTRAQLAMRALTTSKERQELRSVGRKPLKLQYLKRSKQMMGFALWNVLSPVAGYTIGPDNGFPTFSLQTLKDKGLI